VRVDRYGAILSVLLAVAMMTCAASSSGRPDPWSKLPAKTRSQAHLKASALPPFPGEADSLLDIHRWPPSMTLEGRVYRLMFQESHLDVMRQGLSNLGDLSPGTDYGAYYVLNAEDSPFSGRGPSYYWSPDSSLTSRSFRTSSGVQGWQYDSKGRIYSYSRWNQTAPELVELYSGTGDLVGVAFRNHGTAYWKGVPKTLRQFSDSAGVWLPIRLKHAD